VAPRISARIGVRTFPKGYAAGPDLSRVLASESGSAVPVVSVRCRRGRDPRELSHLGTVATSRSRVPTCCQSASPAGPHRTGRRLKGSGWKRGNWEGSWTCQGSTSRRPCTMRASFKSRVHVRFSVLRVRREVFHSDTHRGDTSAAESRKRAEARWSSLTRRIIRVGGLVFRPESRVSECNSCPPRPQRPRVHPEPGPRVRTG